MPSDRKAAGPASSQVDIIKKRVTGATARAVVLECVLGIVGFVCRVRVKKGKRLVHSAPPSLWVTSSLGRFGWSSSPVPRFSAGT